MVEDDSIEAMDIKKTLESAGFSIPEIAPRDKEPLRYYPISNQILF
ncbi:MAG TPA: hypothetical protein VF324_00770 [Methanobacterium sp.]